VSDACWVGRLPTHAVANIVGNINGQEFGVSRLSANIDRVDGANRLTATLTNTPPTISMIQSIVQFLLCVTRDTDIRVVRGSSTE